MAKTITEWKVGAIRITHEWRSTKATVSIGRESQELDLTNVYRLNEAVSEMQHELQQINDVLIRTKDKTYHQMLAGNKPQ